MRLEAPHFRFVHELSHRTCAVEMGYGCCSGTKQGQSQNKVQALTCICFACLAVFTQPHTNNSNNSNSSDKSNHSSNSNGSTSSKIFSVVTLTIANSKSTTMGD